MAGSIILAAAPFTAIVFVWSYLADGDPAYTLVQVSLNDLIMLVLFAPIVGLLVTGASTLAVPFRVLWMSVVIFIVIPLALGAGSRIALRRWKGAPWFDSRFLPAFHPVTVVALLATLVLIFAFQSDSLTLRFFHVVLIAIPLLIQVYFNAGLAYGLMRWLRVRCGRAGARARFAGASSRGARKGGDSRRREAVLHEQVAPRHEAARARHRGNVGKPVRLRVPEAGEQESSTALSLLAALDHEAVDHEVLGSIDGAPRHRARHVLQHPDVALQSGRAFPRAGPVPHVLDN